VALLRVDEMDVIGSDAAYATAWVVGSVACVMLLNRVLATNRKMPKVAKPFGVVKDGILWNATTVGACAGPETIDGASTVHELMELAFSQWSSESAAGKRPLLKRYYEEIKPGQTVEKLTFADECAPHLQHMASSLAPQQGRRACLASGLHAAHGLLHPVSTPGSACPFPIGTFSLPTPSTRSKWPIWRLAWWPSPS
jgi:hypothetical protein